MGFLTGAIAAKTKNPLALLSPAAALLMQKKQPPSLVNPTPTSVGSTSKSSIMY